MVWVAFIVGFATVGGFGLIVVSARGAGTTGGARRVVQFGGLGRAMHCVFCGTDWPPDARAYGRCPACLEPTRAISGFEVTPLDPRRARSLRLHHEFERYCAARDRNNAA